MRNLFITNLHKKDVNHFTSNHGLFLRRKLDKPFKEACNLFTNAHIIRVDGTREMSDEEFYTGLSFDFIPRENYTLSQRKRANNIVVERYPELEKDESYIFVGNHTCPEDIETMLNIIEKYVEEAFRKLKWRHDVFDAEYLVKKNKVDREYEDTIKTLGDLRLEKKVLSETGLDSRYWIRKKEYLEKENVAGNMRKYFREDNRFYHKAE